MNSAEIGNLLNLLKCAVCLDLFKNSRTLECSHCFCLECIKHILVDNIDVISIACPLCRQITVLEHSKTKLTNVISELPKNYILEQLVEVFNVEILKTKINDLKIEDSKKDIKTSSNICRNHKDKSCCSYCKDCNDLMCRICTVTCHKDHKFISIEQLYLEYKSDNISNMNEFNLYSLKLNQSKSLIKGTIEHLDERCSNIKYSINKSHESLIQQINKHKEKLFNSLDAIHNKKSRVLNAQLDHLELEIGKMTGFLKYLNSFNIEKDNFYDYLSLKKSFEKFSNNFNQIQLYPEEDDSIIFNENLKYLESSNLIGELSHVPVFACLSEAKGDGINLAKAYVAATFVVIAMTSYGLKKNGGDSIKVSIADSNDNLVESFINDNNDGTYLVKYTPILNGTHIINVLINNHPIKNSPFKVTVQTRRNYEEIKQAQFKFGQFGFKKKEFKSPMGVSIDKQGNIYVADSYNHRIQVFRSKGEFVTSFGESLPRKERLACPCGISIDNDQKRIYISDSSNNKIHVFKIENETKYPVFNEINSSNTSLNINWVKSVGCEGIKNGQFKSPTGIYYCHRTKELIVADVDNQRLQIFDENLEFLYKIPLGTHVPAYVTVDYENENIIYFTDSKINKLVSVDRRDASLMLNSNYQISSNELVINQPRGISIDQAGNLIIADSGNSRIIIISKEGQLIKSFKGDGGLSDGILGWPEDVAISEDGLLIVTDLSNNRICIF